MTFRSSLSTLFTPDSPVALVANWFMDRADRQRIDDQIRALQEQATYSLRGQLTTMVQLSASSAAGAAGDCVCIAPVAAVEDNPLAALRQVTRATTTPIAAGGVVLGILATAAAPGAFCRIIFDGIVGSQITGLAAGSAGPVRLDLTTGRCLRVASLASGHYPIGYVDALGNLSLARGLAIP